MSVQKRLQLLMATCKQQHPKRDHDLETSQKDLASIEVVPSEDACKAAALKSHLSQLSAATQQMLLASFGSVFWKAIGWFPGFSPQNAGSAINHDSATGNAHSGARYKIWRRCFWLEYWAGRLTRAQSGTRSGTTLLLPTRALCRCQFFPCFSHSTSFYP